jgi:hypothetical protein
MQNKAEEMAHMAYSSIDEVANKEYETVMMKIRDLASHGYKSAYGVNITHHPEIVIARLKGQGFTVKTSCWLDALLRVKNKVNIFW